MYVMGTAGHVDHGKSTLVIALSGIDPDRLPEEKARGMTIDLGFAWMTTTSGQTIGIVDVPGHERLVKNMIAGVGALDFVLLIVAADDGWMPQSAEHLAILRFMNVKRGIVVVTKADIVDPDLLELVCDDVRDQVQGTFLADAPILAVDSVSQRGLDALKSEIDSLVATLTPRRDIGHPRLYVDRVFSIAGRGAVVTGTLIDGSFKLGQSIQVAPSGKSGRIRDLQIHKTHVDEAAPGQRVAVNVSGLDLDELRRGDCLTVADAADVTDRLWAQVTIWSEATQPLKPGRPVLVMLGTSEPEAEAYPVGGELIAPGTSGLCELRLHEPIVARLKDRFVLRWPTPQVTIGGGEVLEVGGTKRSHREPSFVASLRARIEGDLKAFILSQLQRTGFTPRAAIIPNSPWSISEIDAQLEALMAADALIKSGTLYFDREWFDGAADRLLTVLTATHKKQPQSPGLNLSEWGIRARVPDAAMTGIAAQLISDGKVARSGDAYHLSTHAAKLPDEWREIEATLWEKLTSAGMQPPTRDELEQSAPHARAIVQFWIGAGRVKTLGDGLIFASETFSEIRKRVIAALKKEGALTASQLRDVLGTTRKYAVPIGEALDHEGLTQREGDVRVLVVDHRQEKESP